MARTNPTAEAIQVSKLREVAARLTEIQTVAARAIPTRPPNREELVEILEDVDEIRRLAISAGESVRRALSIEGEREG